MDYGDNALDVEALEAIQLELDAEDDAPIVDWFYDPKPLIDIPSVNGSSYKYWLLLLPEIATVSRLRRTLLSDQPDRNASYLLDKKSFFMAKVLNAAIPGGPKFIICQQIGQSTKMPFLIYNSLPRSVRISVYHSPTSVYIQTDDPDLPAFYFDPLINPISLRGSTPKNMPPVSHEDSIFGSNGADNDDFELPQDINPFLEDKKLENDLSADGIALW